MNEWTDQDHAAFAVEDPLQREVDEALRTYPLNSAPPTLAPRVMARIRALTPAPRFRLAWIDYAISLFVTGMGALIFILWQAIPPLEAVRARMQVSFVLMHIPTGLLWPALLGGVIAMGAALLAAGIVFARLIEPHVPLRNLG